MPGSSASTDQWSLTPLLYCCYFLPRHLESTHGQTGLALLHLDRALREIESFVKQGKADAGDLAALKTLRTRIRQSVAE